MNERLGPSKEIHKVDPSILVPTEMPLTYSGSHGAIAALICDNIHVAAVVQEKLSDLSENTTYEQQEHVNEIIRSQIPHEPLAISLVLRSESPKIITDISSFTTDQEGGADFYHKTSYPKTSDRESDVIYWTKEIREDNPANVIYDLLVGYDPALDKTIADKVAIFTPYFEEIKKRVLHKGILVIQLDETNPNDAEETKRMNDHNLAIEIALSNNGFLVNDKTCQRVRYEKPDGTQGTIFVFEQQDYAEGEKKPEASTAVDVPLDATAAVTEVERILEKVAVARR